MENEHKDARDHQAEAEKSQVYLLHPPPYPSSGELIELQGPRGWQSHQMEGNSVLIHHLVESHPPTEHTHLR